MAKIELKHIWKIFGDNPQQILRSVTPADSRREVQQKTGHVIGVRDVSLAVAPGEVFVVMGLSGSGKSTLGNRSIKAQEVKIVLTPDACFIASKLARPTVQFTITGVLPASCTAKSTIMETADAGSIIPTLCSEKALIT